MIRLSHIERKQIAFFQKRAEREEAEKSEGKEGGRQGEREGAGWEEKEK